jgi:hypothetical protein
LFIIYINGLPQAIEYPIVLFADDSTILFASNDAESYEDDINATLEIVIDWLTNNNLRINLEKTKIVSFKQRSNNARNLNISYNGQQIDETDVTITKNNENIILFYSRSWRLRRDVASSLTDRFA